MIETHLDKLKKDKYLQLKKINFLFVTHQVISLKIAISSLHDEIPSDKKKEFYNMCKDVALLSEYHNALMIYL